MSKGKLENYLSRFDPADPNSLRGLDEDTFIGLIARLIEQNRQLSEALQKFLQEKYGLKNERFIDPDQMRLFQSEEENQACTAEDTDVQSGDAGSAKPRKKRPARNPRPSNVAHVTIPVNQSLEDCSCCNRPMVKVNQVLLHSRFDYKPSSVSIQDFVENVYACSQCQSSLVSAADAAELICENDTVEQECAPNAVSQAMCELIKAAVDDAGKKTPEDSSQESVEGSLSTIKTAAARVVRCQASPAMLSYVAISKYCDYLPLYRLEQILARHGAPLARSTMCGWLKLVADLLRGLYEFMRSKLLESNVVWTDDTPIKVQDRKKSKNIKLGRIWVYIGDKSHPFILFDYTQGRGRDGPKTFLRGYNRYLQGDCFSGNLAIAAENGATFVACNVHARRYFKKALLNYKSKSEEALRQFGLLFEVERVAKELALSPDDIRLMREQESRPILDALKTWLDQEQLLALPKSAFGQAINYCLNNWEALTSYLEDGDLTVGNNVAEREMKAIATGRKSWLFFGSDDGGERAEVLLSIISTCKRHGVEPQAYLTSVIERLVENPATDPEDLLPHVWKEKQAKTEMTAGQLPQKSLNLVPMG
jgi:transposase